MNVLEFAKRREFVQCLLEVGMAGITRGRGDDAESVIGGIRELRPDFHHLDFYEGWLATLRGDWPGACRIAEVCVERTGGWRYAEALLAYCKFATCDPTWSSIAQGLLDSDDKDGARDMMLALMGRLEPADDAAPASAAVPVPAEFAQHFMRA